MSTLPRSNATSPAAAPEPALAVVDTRRILSGLSGRAVMLGLLLTIPNTLWITIVEVRWYTLDGTSLPLFITPVFFLFWLVLGNVAVKRVRPARAFTQGELLTVYIFLVIGSLLAGHDMFQNLFGAIGHADRYQTPENRWKDLFFAFLPRFWLVRDPASLKAYYEGGASIYHTTYWLAFVRPLTYWAIFMGALVGVCLCLNVLIRTQWTKDERLAFPIVQLPMALTEAGGGGLLRSRAMWMGFSVAAAIDIINGLHYLYPSFPYLEMVKLYNVGQHFTTHPWNAVHDTNISMYPFAIGLAFFVPLDLSFSCWFFFVARKLFEVFGSAAGMDAQGSGFPYFEQQGGGAWVAWGLAIAWALRGQLRRTWAIAFRGAEPSYAEPGIARQYRFAFIGIAAGVAVLAVYSRELKLAPWLAVGFFGLYFLIAITLTRVRAELGTPHEIYFVNPRNILVTVFGTQAIGAQGLTSISVMHWFNRGYRCHPMPNELEAMRMGESARIRQGAILWLLALALIWGTVVAYWANLHVTFAEGASSRALGFKSWVGGESYDRLGNWLKTPERAEFTKHLYFAAGFAIVLFLRLMRTNFLWWPFHPAGYALAISYSMEYFWFCFFIAWLLKLIIIRTGGMRLYNASVPFFLGLVLGDYVMGSFRALYGPLNHVVTYKIYI